MITRIWVKKQNEIKREKTNRTMTRKRIKRQQTICRKQKKRLQTINKKRLKHNKHKQANEKSQQTTSRNQ